MSINTKPNKKLMSKLIDNRWTEYNNQTRWETGAVFKIIHCSLHYSTWRSEWNEL